MLWKKNLELSYDDTIIDIVQFGSSVKEGTEPNDIDLVVLFKDIPIKEQLNKAQNIKEQLETQSTIPIHIKPLTYKTLFAPGNFAKEGIIGYGMSLITKKPFSEQFSMKANTYITYSLQEKTKTEKVRVHYNLRGKKGEYGILREVQGTLVKPGMIKVAPQKEDAIIRYLEEEKVTYEKKVLLEIQ